VLGGVELPATVPLFTGELLDEVLINPSEYVFILRILPVPKI
jgi:hypothetical protein